MPHLKNLLFPNRKSLIHDKFSSGFNIKGIFDRQYKYPEGIIPQMKFCKNLVDFLQNEPKCGILFMSRWSPKMPP